MLTCDLCLKRSPTYSVIPLMSRRLLHFEGKRPKDPWPRIIQRNGAPDPVVNLRTSVRMNLVPFDTSFSSVLFPY
jgi:hypothetical protein